jgi:hypothetical protein
MSQQVKKRRREMDGQECRFCGLTAEEHREQYDQTLHVHHIVPQRSDGPGCPENLVTVCRDCHHVLEETQVRGIEQLPEPDRELEEQRDSLLDRVEQLERAIRDPQFYGEIAGGSAATAHIATEYLGPRTSMFTDVESAKEAYDEWATELKRIRIKADAEDITRRAETSLNRSWQPERSVQDLLDRRFG